MRESKIHRIDRTPGMVKAEEFFLDKEVITNEDIKNIATLVAKDIRAAIAKNQNSEVRVSKIVEILSQIISIFNSRFELSPKEKPMQGKETAILKMLQRRDVLDKSGMKRVGIARAEYQDDNLVYKAVLDGEEIEIDAAEIDTALDKVRAAVLEELKNDIDEVELEAIVRKIGLSRVYNLHGGTKVFKEKAFWEKQKNENTRAINYLHELEPKSPYIIYSVLESDSKVGNLQTERRICTLEEEILNSETSPDLSRAIEYFIQALRGADFLVKNGLVITDNTLDNIGIDKEQDRAGLFDFDGLFFQDTETQGYITKQDKYRPPEKRVVKNGVIGEKQMIYEFGVSLKRMLSYYDYSQTKEMLLVAEEMKAAYPEDRISIAEAIAALEKCL